MKNLLLSAIILSVMVLFSCGKNDPSIHAITGNWNIVSDTTWSSGIGPNGTPSGNKYTGVAGDHFNFTSSGKLYVKEGNIKLDTANYTISGDTLKLTYRYLYEGGVTVQGASGSFIISTLTNQSLILTEDFLTPGGRIDETITLSRNN